MSELPSDAGMPESTFTPIEEKSSELTSYGIGLTKLCKFAKTVGRDPKLARKLWLSKIHEMEILALLIDDPMAITIEQAEQQVEQLQGRYRAHVFSSCDATLARAPIVVEPADKWIMSNNPMCRRCGYGLFYEISRNKKIKAHRAKIIFSLTSRISTRRNQGRKSRSSWQWPGP